MTRTRFLSFKVQVSSKIVRNTLHEDATDIYSSCQVVALCDRPDQT